MSVRVLFTFAQLTSTAWLVSSCSVDERIDFVGAKGDRGHLAKLQFFLFRVANFLTVANFSQSWKFFSELQIFLRVAELQKIQRQNYFISDKLSGLQKDFFEQRKPFKSNFTPRKTFCNTGPSERRECRKSGERLCREISTQRSSTAQAKWWAG